MKDEARAEREANKYVVLDATNGNILKKYVGLKKMCEGRGGVGKGQLTVAIMKEAEEEGVLHRGKRFRVRLYDENVDGLFDVIDSDEDRLQILKDEGRFCRQ